MGCRAYFSRLWLVRCYANKMRKIWALLHTQDSPSIIIWKTFFPALKLHYCFRLNEVTGDGGE